MTGFNGFLVDFESVRAIARESDFLNRVMNRPKFNNLLTFWTWVVNPFRVDMSKIFRQVVHETQKL